MLDHVAQGTRNVSIVDGKDVTGLADDEFLGWRQDHLCWRFLAGHDAVQQLGGLISADGGGLGGGRL